MDNYSLGEGLLGIVVFLILVIVFWMPTIIAYKSQKSNRLTIGILNFIFAATGIGSLILLYMSLSKDQRIKQMKL